MGDPFEPPLGHHQIRSVVGAYDPVVAASEPAAPDPAAPPLSSKKEISDSNQFLYTIGVSASSVSIPCGLSILDKHPIIGLSLILAGLCGYIGLMLLSIKYRVRLVHGLIAALVIILLAALGYFIVTKPKEGTEEFRRPLPTSSGSSGIYIAPGAAASNNVMENSQITGCNKPIDNNGLLDNFYMKNSTIQCAPNAGSPVASPAAPAPTKSATPHPDTPNPGTSGLTNAPGVSTSDTAVMNSAVHGCRNGLQFQTSGNDTVINNLQVYCHQP
jgi:hypothetical protein